MAGTRDRSKQAEGERHPKPVSFWEHVAAAVGALVVVAAVGFMVYEALTVPRGAVPELAVRVDSIIPQGRQHLVRFTIRNDGDATAARVQVEGELRADTGAVEKSQTSLDYVPAGSQRQAGVIFTRDRTRYRLRLRPLGWERP